jgi:hypothetical protein
MTSPDDEPEGGWPTTPRRLGDLFDSQMPWLRGLPRYSEDPAGFVAGFVARAKADQAKANQRTGGLFLPEPEPERTSPAAATQERWAAIVSPANSTWRLHNVTDHVADRVEVVEKWLDAKAAKPLLLEGEPGSGKTALACAAAHQWWKGGARPVIFAPVADLMTTEATEATDTLRRRLGNVSDKALVVLDDLTGTSASWGSFAGHVDRIVRAGARIITTTNLHASQRRDADLVDPRVRSRLEGVVIPLAGPDLRPAGQAPEGPDVGPCPFHCEPPGVFAMGQLDRCDIPEVARLTEDFIEAEMVHDGPAPYYGIRRPDPLDYAEVSPAEAERYLAAAWARWDRAFDWHATNTGHWCPHCRPEQCRPDGWLERTLASLGRPVVLPD